MTDEAMATTASSPYSARETAATLERATATLQRTYERWIAKGSMRREHAERQVAILQSAASHFRRLANQSQHNLFEGNDA